MTNTTAGIATIRLNSTADELEARDTDTDPIMVPAARKGGAYLEVGDKIILASQDGPIFFGEVEDIDLGTAYIELR